MNIHHLELFFYVARHGGITEAARQMPYGIQQPAVSAQVAQLEEYLGVTLFNRRPFALTPPGQKLFNFIEPFFSKVDAVATEIQGGQTHQLRIGASEIVLRDYLPELLTVLRKKFPALKIELRQGYQPDLERALERDQLDLALTLVEKKTPPGIQSRALIEMPLVLLVPANSRYTAAKDFWNQDKITESLICLPASEAICKRFNEGLRRRSVDWFCSIEVASLGLIETYVANGFGVGLSVSYPQVKASGKIRAILLDDFDPVVLGILWRGKRNAVFDAFFNAVQERAAKLKEG